MLKPVNVALKLGLVSALILMVGISCVGSDELMEQAERSEALGYPDIAEDWVASKISADEAVDVDLSSMGLEKQPISEVPLGNNHSSSVTASYESQTGSEVVRIIALQYLSAAAMEQDKGSGLPYFELEESLADLYCHPPVCNWDFYMFEPWVFVAMYYDRDFQDTQDGVYDVLSGKR
jgi:hypothetical protein